MPYFGDAVRKARVTVYAETVSEQPDTPVRFRRDMMSLPVYRQGNPPPPGGIKLSSNEVPFSPSAAVQQALANGQWNRYPDATALGVRQRLAKKYGVSSDEVLVGAGSVALLAQWITAAAGPGDEVVYSWRSFEAYPGLVSVAGATSVQVPNTLDHRHDIDGLVQAVTDRTRVLIVCTPNNPTSQIVTRDEFENLMSRVPTSLLVILDEAYAEFVDHPDAVDGRDYFGQYPNLVVLRTLSKAYGLAGLRIGYAIASPGVIAPARAAAIPLSVSAPAQIAAEAALDHEDEILGRLQAIRDQMARVRSEWRGSLLPVPWGNFAWLPVGGNTDTVSGWLEEEGVVARVFAGEGIRVSIAEPEGVDALLRVGARIVSDLQPETSPAPLG
jgi:histidinol-phosphate aminotransferase